MEKNRARRSSTKTTIVLSCYISCPPGREVQECFPLHRLGIGSPSWRRRTRMEAMGEGRLATEDGLQERSTCFDRELLSSGHRPWLADPCTILLNHTLEAFRRTSSLAIQSHTSASRASIPAWLSRRHCDTLGEGEHTWECRSECTCWNWIIWGSKDSHLESFDNV